jgi:hypothetical protein
MIEFVREGPLPLKLASSISFSLEIRLAAGVAATFPKVLVEE